MEKQGFVGAEDALTEQILGVFFQVYNELGYGFVESVYGRAMAIALKQAGLRVWLPRFLFQCRFAANQLGRFELI